MELLERDHLLESLRRLLEQAGGGRGCLLLVGGEAGVGKTTLLRRFLEEARAGVRVLVGNCDPLSTPRALGPLFDVAEPALLRLLEEDAPRDLLFRSLLRSFAAKARATLLAIEDVHWADEATLDLLRFLGRRIEPTHGLIVATYRDDEIGPRHPLRRVLGELATTPAVQRLAVTPLSPHAVSALANGSGLNAAELYDRTGGNPFFVTEILAAGGTIPPTVRDAVLARASRLEPAAWALLEAAAVIGSPVDGAVLESIAGPAQEDLESCLATGMLLAEGESLRFRHELARETILHAIPPPRRVMLHARILRVLEAAPPHFRNSARLAHHAEEAGDTAAVLRHSRDAACEAARLGAHREEASHYARLLRFATTLPPAERARILEARSHACYLTAQIEQAIAARREALSIWMELGEPLLVGENRCRLATLLWAQARIAEAEREAEDAITLLEPIAPGPELAMAYGTLARLLGTTLADDEAIRLGERAIALAEQFGTPETRIDALITVGEAKLARGMAEPGQRQVELGMQLATDAGLDALTARSYISLGYGSEACGRLEAAVHHFERGIQFCRDRDLDLPRHHMTALLARCQSRLGDWDAAWRLASAVLQAEEVAPGTRFEALLVAGTLLARRGEPGVAPLLDEALALATTSACIYFLGPVRAARAEAAYLAGDLAGVVRESAAAFDVAVERGQRWYLGELAYWRWKGGDLTPHSTPVAEPFAWQIAGAWRRAAAAWDALGCSYEAARARAEGNDEGALRAALGAFDALGARPAATAVRLRLRALGARGIPRGPRPSTRLNIAGLTAREVDVLTLLVRGYTNREIAEHLFLSSRTVENHVAAILAKLGVTTRADAIAATRQLLPQSE